jgi:hypothetical protein
MDEQNVVLNGHLEIKKGQAKRQLIIHVMM